MKITKNSKELMLFFTKNKYIKKVNQTKRTDSILLQLYKDILNAYLDLNNVKSVKQYYKLQVKKINKNARALVKQFKTAAEKADSVRSVKSIGKNLKESRDNLDVYIQDMQIRKEELLKAQETNQVNQENAKTNAKNKLNNKEKEIKKITTYIKRGIRGGSKEQVKEAKNSGTITKELQKVEQNLKEALFAREGIALKTKAFETVEEKENLVKEDYQGLQGAGKISKKIINDKPYESAQDFVKDMQVLEQVTNSELYSSLREKILSNLDKNFSNTLSNRTAKVVDQNKFVENEFKALQTLAEQGIESKILQKAIDKIRNNNKAVDSATVTQLEGPVKTVQAEKMNKDFARLDALQSVELDSATSLEYWNIAKKYEEKIDSNAAEGVVPKELTKAQWEQYKKKKDEAYQIIRNVEKAELQQKVAQSTVDNIEKIDVNKLTLQQMQGVWKANYIANRECRTQTNGYPFWIQEI